jgi:nucleoside-diphosphate-sugar epimerase
MRVLVTGGTGYLGTVLLGALAARPEIERITAVSLSEPRRPLPAKVTFRKLDIRSPELATVVSGHQVVIHTAAVVLWPYRMPAEERDSINFEGTLQVAKAALEARVSKFIHASSMGAYDPHRIRDRTGVTEDFPLGSGTSSYYYWDAKAAQESLINEVFRATHVKVTHLRATYIMGPTNRGAALAYKNNAVNFPGANPRRQFIDERDVAEAFLLAVLQDMPGAYNVVPDDYMHLREIWSLAGATFVPTVPLALAKAITWLRWRFLGSMVHPMWVEDLLFNFTGSNARLKAMGWRPRYTSRQAFEAAVRSSSEPLQVTDVRKGVLC